MSPVREKTPAQAATPKVSPEDAAILAKLDGIMPEVRTPTLEAAVLTAGRVARLHEDHQAKALAVETDLKAAVASGDLDAAYQAATRRLAMSTVTSLLPAVSGADELLWKAVDWSGRILDQEAHITTIPFPLWASELACWKTVPEQLRGDPPYSLGGDLEAKTIFDRLDKESKRWQEGHAAWKRHAQNRTGNVFHMLGAAEGYRAQSRAFRAEIDEVGQVIRRANLEHRRAGLAWYPPPHLAAGVAGGVLFSREQLDSM